MRTPIFTTAQRNLFSKYPDARRKSQAEIEAAVKASLGRQ